MKRCDIREYLVYDVYMHRNPSSWTHGEHACDPGISNQTDFSGIYFIYRTFVEQKSWISVSRIKLTKEVRVALLGSDQVLSIQFHHVRHRICSCTEKHKLLRLYFLETFSFDMWSEKRRKKKNRRRIVSYAILWIVIVMWKASILLGWRSSSKFN